MQTSLIRNVRAAGHVSSRRDAVVPHFVLKLDGLQAVLSHLHATKSAEGDEGVFKDTYGSMLQKSEESTFACSSGQLSGRADRRCTLEDGERSLEWCIKERPWDLQPRVIQLRNLMKQGLGRERHVPWLAMLALQETGVQDCDISSPCYVQVLQVVLLGLKAVYKLESSCAAVPTNCQHPTYTRTTFLQAAQQAVPGMAHDMLNISQRLHRQLSCCGPDTKKQLLDDRDGFMSSVDLQFVTGEHHALVGSVGVLGEPPVHWPSRVEAQLAGLLGDMPTRKFKELRL